MMITALWMLSGCGGAPLAVDPPSAPPDPRIVRSSLIEDLSEEADAPELFVQIARVFLHPRCAGCHPTDDRPRWHEIEGIVDGVHGMEVQRGVDGRGAPGLRCETCHGARNAPGAHQPPGAPGWHLAPASMGWADHPPARLCGQLKDREQTGGRGLADVIAHVGHDPLVGWAWEPGPGRQPPPGSRDELVALMTRWSDQGAGCPD